MFFSEQKKKSKYKQLIKCDLKIQSFKINSNQVKIVKIDYTC